MRRSPVRSASGGGGSSSYAMAHVWKTDPSVIEITTITTNNTWYQLTVDPDVIDAALLVGITYLGNGVFKNISGAAISRKLFFAGACSGSGGTAAITTFKLGYGKYNGANYVFETGIESATFDVSIIEELANIQNIVLPVKTIARDEQFCFMATRTAGTRNLHISSMVAGF